MVFARPPGLVRVSYPLVFRPQVPAPAPTANTQAPTANPTGTAQPRANLPSGAPPGTATADVAGPPSARTLSQRAIRATVAAQRQDIRACYERALQRAPALEGRVNVHLRIGANGRVQSANIRFSSLEHPETEACILNVTRAIRFPTFEGGSIAVEYPFIFRPST